VGGTEAIASDRAAEGPVVVLSRTSTPHERWLAHLVRSSVGATRAGDPFDDVFPFEPTSVLSLACTHRVAPLLHRGLEDGRVADPIPDEFRAACRKLYYATLRKNAVASSVGREVLDALDRAGIAAAPLKGWALLDGSPPVYADAGVRPMDDLDLMVARDQRVRAMNLLSTLGFRPLTAHAPALAGGHEVAFHRRVAEVDVFLELHWAWAGPESLMRGFAVTGDAFLRELCAGAPGARATRLPTRLGSLLFAAVHGARHAFERWIWLLDLHRLVEDSAFEWSEVAAEARRWRVRAPLYAGLLAARELLRTPVPKELLARLAPGPLRRSLLRRTLASSFRRDGRSRAARAAKLLLGETWWDVARTAAWALRPGEAWYAARGLRRSGSAPPLRTLASRPAGGGVE
jgi:hypothetical protein